MDDMFASTPELKMIMMILDRLNVPDSITHPYDYQGKSHIITIRKVGLNPAMALQVLRTFGVEGIMHSAPTLYFWNADGAASDVCDAFKAMHGDDIFEMVQDAMSSVGHTIH